MTSEIPPMPEPHDHAFPAGVSLRCPECDVWVEVVARVEGDRDRRARPGLDGFMNGEDEATIRRVLECTAQRCPTCNPGDEGAECVGEATGALERIIADRDRYWAALNQIVLICGTDDGDTAVGIARQAQLGEDG